MNILFCHTNYPAQFRRLAPWLKECGHEVVFLHKSIEWHADHNDGVDRCQYSVSRLSSSQSGALHPYLGRFEDAVLEGQAAAREALKLRDSGFEPDVIVSHAGFGNGLYLKDIFPQARRIGFFEWYYNSSEGGDVHFLYSQNNQDVPLDRAMRLRTWNAVTLLELAQSDELVTPTHFQCQQFPESFRSNFHVIHEGIDAVRLTKLKQTPPRRPSCLPSDPSIRIVTHVARGFEVYRGFPQAICALAALQRSMPEVHVLIAGVDQVCYGGPSQAPNGQTWGHWARYSSGLDPSRTHWLGAISAAEYENLLAISEAHLYLTIPFVLSWSLLEAMAVGSPLVCSDTGPVKEVLTDGLDSLLVPIDSPEAQASALQKCLMDPSSALERASAAQDRALNYDAFHGLEGWKALLGAEECQSGKRDHSIDVVA